MISTACSRRRDSRRSIGSGAATDILLGLAAGAGDLSFTAAIPELGPLRGAGQPVDGAGVRLVGRLSHSVPGVLDLAGAGQALFTVPGVYAVLEQDPAGDTG